MIIDYVIKDGGLFEFIPPDEWKAIKALFPQFSIYETACGGYDGAAGNIISNELIQFPLSVLDGCSMYPRELVLQNSHTTLSLNMINLQNVSRWGDIPSHVNKFDKVLKAAFPDIEKNGINHLLSMPNTILLAITSAEQGAVAPNVKKGSGTARSAQLICITIRLIYSVHTLDMYRRCRVRRYREYLPYSVV